MVGTMLFVAAIAAWYLPAFLVGGDLFVNKFLIDQNLRRFGGGDTAHAVPIALWPIYYPVIMLVGTLPWTVWIWRGWPRGEGTDPLARFLVRWAIVWVVFFTISGSKLPHYCLPAIPPLAMLAAMELAKRRQAIPRLVPIHCAIIGAH